MMLNREWHFIELDFREASALPISYISTADLSCGDISFWFSCGYSAVDFSFYFISSCWIVKELN